MAVETTPKWEALITGKLPSIEPDKAWSLVGDFCNLHKLIPSLTTSTKVEGTDGVVGCIRYCVLEPDANGVAKWTNQKLVAIEHSKRSLTYVVTENNLGLKGYCATHAVVECVDGSMLEWKFECQPVYGMTQASFVKFLEGLAKQMAKSVSRGLVCQ